MTSNPTKNQKAANFQLSWPQENQKNLVNFAYFAVNQKPLRLCEITKE